jgi:16S rRNA G966 N2-methylase RsmD
MSVQDLALQRNKYKHLSDAEWRWFLQQVEGRERTADKLPSFAAIEDWWYPVRLSCEQCSSELTARYKAEIIRPSFEGGDGVRLLDLTAGYGVDTYFLSKQFEHTDYIEQNAELCRIAEHNFSLQKSAISIHNCSAEEFLQTTGQYDLIFVDPARRDSHGGKVFHLENCTPNVIELLPELLKHSQRLLFKLSPMLDISQAIKELSAVNWNIYVVAIKNEVKEVLLLSGGNGTITAIDLSCPEQAFTFTREEEKNTTVSYQLSTINYLYEPNAAILKAGAYKLVAQRFKLHKLDPNTHLYASDQYVAHFPGRVWKTSPLPSQKERVIQQANVLVRNYPLTAEQLKKKMRLKDGGTEYIIGCRVDGKPVVLRAERLH